VDIEVFPVQGGLGWTSTISEQVEADTRTLVYSGPVDASDSTFSPTVSLALARDPLRAGGDTFTVVAQAVEMVLTLVTPTTSSTSRTSGSSNGTITTRTSNSTAFGLFEYVRSSSITSAISNSTTSAFSVLGLALNASLPTWAINAFATSSNIVYAAGLFSTANYSNVVSVDVDTGTITPLALQGLNGEVYSAAVVGGNIYFGGNFTSTVSGGFAMGNLARWDPKASTWSAMGNADGVVTELIPSASSSTQLIVVGDFTHVDGIYTGGYAVWDTAKSAWSTSETVFGSVTVATVPTSGDVVYMAGKVMGSSNNPSSGIAMLSTSNGQASISSLNVNFSSTGSASPTASGTRKRSHHHGSYTRSWLSRFTDSLIPRKTIHSRATAITIPVESAPAPAVLAGAFWTNSSGKSMTILGGNFTTLINCQVRKYLSKA
jgi:hypothetical protein